MDNQHLLAYGLAGLAAFYLAYLARVRTPNLSHIPTVGPSGRLTCYLGTLRFLFNSREMIQEGYAKYRHDLFKVASLDKWVVLCCGQQYIDEVSKAGDDEVSIWKAIDQLAALTYTFGEEIIVDPYHVPVIRNTLNRNLSACFPSIRDEIVQSFDDVLALETDKWKGVPALDSMLRIVARTSNRLFVGFPLCRDPDYLELSMQFTVDVIKTAIFVNMVPGFLKPIVGRSLTKLPDHIKRASKHLAPIIEERIRKEAEYGKDWPGKPNDSITWLLDLADGERRSVRGVILRLLAINFSAMHTSSMGFTHALYHLAASPEHAVSLREEVEYVVKEFGWTKTALDHMVKVDNFLKESLRLNGVGAVTLSRVVLKDFTFSDGTRLPAGTFVSVPLSAIHHDESRYINPGDFNPGRFAASKENGDDVPKAQMVTSSTDYLPWGFGRHACPGRWLAATELKGMLAHVVISYDVKLEREGVRPPNEWFLTACIPNRTANVLFRKRTSS